LFDPIPRSRGQDGPDRWSSLGLAAVHRLRGQLREALDEHLRALEIREQAGMETEVAISCVNVGNAYFDLGQHDEAEGMYRRAVTIFEVKGFKNFEAYALSGLGSVFFKSDRPRALRFYEQALRLCWETGTGRRSRCSATTSEPSPWSSTGTARHCGSSSRPWASWKQWGDTRGRPAYARERRSSTVSSASLRQPAPSWRGPSRSAARAVAGWTSLRPTSRRPVSPVDQGDDAVVRKQVADARASLAGETALELRLGCALMLIDLGETESAGREIAEATRTTSERSDRSLRCLLEHLRGLSSSDPGESLSHLERALELSQDEDPELPRLLADLARRTGVQRAKALCARAVEILDRRSRGIESPAGRRRYLLEIPCHREIISLARKAGVDLPASCLLSPSAAAPRHLT